MSSKFNNFAFTITKGLKKMSRRHNNFNKSFLTIILVNLCLYAGLAQGETKVVGWIEDAAITSSRFEVKAKLDTGADSSSLNAVNAEIIERGEDNYIKFKMVNRWGKEIEISEKIVRWTRIKNKFGVKHKRPVIKIDVCVANVMRHVEVNLVDRSNYKYQMLIGRSFLKGTPNLLVDSALKETAKPECN